MHKLIVMAVLVGLAAADHINKDAEVTNYKSDTADSDGNYNFGFDSSNGISVQEQGHAGGTSGQASWVSPEGEKIELTYTADENGYQPRGPHLPTPPPTPDYVLKALEYIRTHPVDDEKPLKVHKL